MRDDLKTRILAYLEAHDGSATFGDLAVALPEHFHNAGDHNLVMALKN